MFGGISTSVNAGTTDMPEMRKKCQIQFGSALEPTFPHTPQCWCAAFWPSLCTAFLCPLTILVLLTKGKAQLQPGGTRQAPQCSSTKPRWGWLLPRDSKSSGAGTVQPGEGEAQGGLINVCKYLKGGCKEQGDSLFSVGPSDRTEIPAGPQDVS